MTAERPHDPFYPPDWFPPETVVSQEAAEAIFRLRCCACGAAIKVNDAVVRAVIIQEGEGIVNRWAHYQCSRKRKI